MTDLQPCAACDRHVASTEPACPFCGAAITPVPPRPAPRRGLSRAALFAGATLATAAACGGGKAKPDPMKGAPTADAGVDATPAQPPDQPDGRNRRVEPPDEGGNRHRGPRPPNMPYGAPPARRRLV
jgi:hypothetical protein